jgi:NADH:ubiquinone oxidoreductase subunit H
MNRLHRLAIFSFVVVASIWTARPATAQDQSRPKPSAPASVSDSVTLADVQKAADQLAIAVQEAVRKATEDPAVKVAALKVAKNAVTAAQIVVTQQADVLQTMLDALAREIAIATDKQQARPKNH